jgi:polyhydroxyalkanoate synthase
VVAETVLRAPVDAVARVRRDVERNALRARNGIKLVTGAGRPRSGQTPKDVVWQQDRATVWRYRSDDVRYGPPLLIVFSLVSKSYILDLAPGNSFVEHLRDEGFDVHLLDWGTPEDRDADNGFEDYVDRYLPAAIDAVREATGSDVVSLVGYCFGGVLSLLSVASNPDLPISSLTTIATPVDYTKMGLMADMFRRTDMDVSDLLDDDGNVPADVLRTSFRVLKPTAELATYANLLDNLWNDSHVTAHQLMTGWTTDHVPFPGRIAQQCVDMLVRANGFVTDRLRVGGRKVSLSDVTVPFLNVVASKDHIVPVESARPVMDLVGSTSKDELVLEAGHIGLAVGRNAHKVTIPKIVEFLRAHSTPVADPSSASPTSPEDQAS